MEELNVGIDIGASYIKIAALNGNPEPEVKGYFPHFGNPLMALSKNPQYLPQIPFHLGVTGSGGHLLTDRFEISLIQSIRAEIRAVNHRFSGVNTIINIGAGSSTLINLDKKGNFVSQTANSLCAAGTGSFLDEQAERLGIDYQSLQEIEFDDDPPVIASRCAVFAKSDLIHRQQDGYSKQAMWAGLCKGCVDTFLQTLLRGKPLGGPTVITGGVTQNSLIMKWLRKYYGDLIMTWSDAHLSGAIGAAALANGTAMTAKHFGGRLQGGSGPIEVSTRRGPELTLRKTRYPSFEVAKEWLDDQDNEIRLWIEPKLSLMKVYLGIDIGSTSTKLVLLDEDRRVVLDIYRKTLGDPLGAVRKLFTAVEAIQNQFNVEFQTEGCATTGSGRKFIGKIIGADRVINEISAHVAGAMKVDPEIDTIFEIGGQDSKYMRTVGGLIRDSNMNFICAAGTGSFVEEQAKKLGFSVKEVGDLVLDLAPPQTSDRCTVFMEEDTNKLLRQGFTGVEAMAGVLQSVVKNYLNKVVGNRPFSKHKIFFQGATARNKGLVAAFENLLDVEMVVSPLCHQMGSYGVALLVAEQMEKDSAATTFRGFDLAHRQIDLTHEPCDLCNNHCRITSAHIAGNPESPSWGFLCGKEPDQTKRKVNHDYTLFRQRDRLYPEVIKNQPVALDAQTITISASLTTHSLLPFWTALFNEMGLRVKLTEATNEATKQAGVQNAPGDFCYPIKLAIGHALIQTETNDDFLLLAQTISDTPSEHTTNSLFCPYVQSAPSVIRSTLQMKGLNTDHLLMPVLDLRWDAADMAKELQRSLGQRFGKNLRTMKKALAAAFAAQSKFGEACQQKGKQALAELKAKGQKAIAVIGRPYNCFDPGANIGLPEKISEYGYTVIPIDFLPFDSSQLGEEFGNVYWAYGQRIIAAVKTVAEADNLFPVYLSNFSCGPDSFLLTYAEKIMGDKPMLILELDEHGADAGYVTRIEAFLDVVDSYRDKNTLHRYLPRPCTTDDLKKRTLWIPPMHPHAGIISEGVFERYGYRAKALPPEDRETFEIGRRAVRGSECLPTSLTIGSFLKKLKEIDADPAEHAFFMATANGPCRFGQYATLHRMILDDHGYQDVRILSPSSFNSYQGIEEPIRRLLWQAFLAADFLLKMECKVRPYEKNPGQTNEIVARQVKLLRNALATNSSMKKAMGEATAALNAVERHEQKRPLVGIIGEIYVRSNPYSNGYVIDHIEQFGGEAWLTPLSEWMLYTAHIQKWTAKQKMRGLSARGMSILRNHFLHSYEKKYYSYCEPLLNDRHEPPIERVVEEGRRFLPVNFEGEAIITMGRAIEFSRSGASLVVNCAPFGCMPGTITDSLFQQVQAETGVPIVSMYYDGEGEINKQLAIYLNGAEAKGDVTLH